VVRLREDYAAVREGEELRARINYETFLDVLIPTILPIMVPNPCSSISISNGKYPLHAVNGYWVSSTSPLLENPVNIDDKCHSEKVSETIPRGIPGLTTHTKMSHDFGDKSHCVSEVDSYRWNRHICAYKKKPSIIHDSDLIGDIIDPKSSSKVVLTSQNDDYVSYRGREKSILFVGGIHMRGLAALFLSEVCQYQNPQLHLDHNILRVQFVELSKSAADRHRQKHAKECKKDPSQCELFDSGCQGLTVGYLGGESSCRPEMTVHFSQFNYVVMNCGHIQSSSYAAHRSSISQFLDSVLSAKLKNSNLLFWVESTAPVLREEQLEPEKKDRRTYYRMLLYHQILQEEVLAKKMQEHLALIPAFQSTLALADKLCDCVGSPATALMPQLISLVDAIRKANHRIAHAKSKEIFQKQPL